MPVHDRAVGEVAADDATSGPIVGRGRAPPGVDSWSMRRPVEVVQALEGLLEFLGDGDGRLDADEGGLPVICNRHADQGSPGGLRHTRPWSIGVRGSATKGGRGVAVKRRSRPWPLVVVSLCNFVMGGWLIFLSVCAGLAMMAVGLGFGDVTTIWVGAIFALGMGGLGATQVAAGVGLLLARRWAVTLTLLFAGLALFSAVAEIVADAAAAGTFVYVYLAYGVMAVVLVYMPSTRAVFRRPSTTPVEPLTGSV